MITTTDATMTTTMIMIMIMITTTTTTTTMGAVTDHDHGCEYDHDHDHEHDVECDHHHDHHHHHDHGHEYAHEYVDDMMDDDEADDDESYGDGPLTGLLYRDTQYPGSQADRGTAHDPIKSCILDNAGSGLTRAGENLQKTRCRMFLALDCGKSLLREMLVFIAVWEKDEQSLIFQVTTQIVEALHHSALIPYAWNSLRIPKDVISPAQTVLLRLINHMFRARLNTATAQDLKDNTRDVRLVHFFYSFFRSRIVPECTALMHLQGQIREENRDPAEFPVDSWDMERAKDGLAQYLEFLTTVAEMSDMKVKLIEWEAVYDLVTILTGLEAGVPKKAMFELPKRGPYDSGCPIDHSLDTRTRGSLHQWSNDPTRPATRVSPRRRRPRRRYRSPLTSTRGRASRARCSPSLPRCSSRRPGRAARAIRWCRSRWSSTEASCRCSTAAPTTTTTSSPRSASPSASSGCSTAATPPTTSSASSSTWRRLQTCDPLQAGRPCRR